MFHFTLPVLTVVAFIAAKFASELCLDMLNIKNVRAHAAAVPDKFRSFVDFPTYSKSVSYTIDKTRFGIIEGGCNALFLMLVVALWLLPKMFDLGMDVFGSSAWAQALTIICIMIVLSLPMLPFDWCMQFVIEQQYGFNKSTLSLWIADTIKSAAVGVVLGLPILTLILWFADTYPKTWWIWGFCAVAAFQILMIVIYPRVIVPLFNKLEDLPDGELKTALFALADRGGFKAKTIQVIDGSRRSTHSNAYFTGFGRFRRIVLFDTLLEHLDTREIEAVLAHEIGHYKRGHVLKLMGMNFLLTFLTFALMGLMVNSQWFYLGFGFCEASGFGPVFMIFSLYAGFFSYWLTPVMNMFSRKYEYEADAFSASLCGSGLALDSALRKLYSKNLGNLTPHPLYSAFHYSHPTLSERRDALLKAPADNQNTVQ